MAATNDSDDLEALFDSIAATSTVPSPVQVVPAPAQVPVYKGVSLEVGDNDELQELFDSLCVANSGAPGATVGEQDLIAKLGDQDSDSWPKQEVVFNQIFQQTGQVVVILTVHPDAKTTIDAARHSLSEILSFTGEYHGNTKTKPPINAFRNHDRSHNRINLANFIYNHYPGFPGILRCFTTGAILVIEEVADGGLVSIFATNQEVMDMALS